jgi:type II secretory pathway component PulF
MNAQERIVGRLAPVGAITIALIVFTAVVLLFLQMRELPEFVSLFQRGVEGDGQSILLFTFMVFVTAVTTILSLIVTRR